MSHIRTTQIVGAIHLVTPSLKFSDEASQPAASQALGSNGGDAGGLNVVPNLNMVAPINREWSVGPGVNAPLGLVTEYDNGWIGRFQAIKSSIPTINVNPGVSWRPAERLAVGFGLKWQRMSAEFTNQGNYSGALSSAAVANGIAPGSDTFNAIAQATPGLESAARVKGLDNALGWNAGAIWELGNDTRLGAR